jgi:cytochrome c553
VKLLQVEITWRRAAGFAVGLGVLLLVGGLLFAWSGIYSLAASAGHFAITERFLRFALHGSVRTHTLTIEAPPLGSRDQIILGAAHYAGGCAPCHGAPGMPLNRITAAMLPPPTDLSTVLDEWAPEQLYWIVRHGIKYTGMPAWPAQLRSDEVWAVIAFLEELPRLDAQSYAALAGLPLTGDTRAAPDSMAVFSEALTVCARCHGDAETPPSSRLAPRLSGQKAAYLKRALREYAVGARFSGMMQPVAAELGTQEIDRLAGYYAELAQPEATTPEPDRDPAVVARGRAIATNGIPETGIPACLACHGAGAADVFPALNGQHAPYIVAQLEAFREGHRGRTATDAIMQTIAARLGDDEIAAVAAYLASIATGQIDAAAGPEQPAGGAVQ